MGSTIRSSGRCGSSFSRRADAICLGYSGGRTENILWNLAKLADGKHVFFLDVNHVFLRPDGTLDPKLMPDQLHPSPDGALVWARAMEPVLSELFGDQPRTVALPAGP